MSLTPTQSPNATRSQDMNMPSLRVLQVATGLAWGGGEKHIIMLLESFKDSPVQHQLAVLHDGQLAAEARKRGARVHFIPKRFRGDVSVIYRLRKLLRQERFDIIHTHLLGGNFYGRIAGRLAGMRGVISTLHYISPAALSETDPTWLHRLLFRMDLSTTCLSDRLIATSGDMRHQLSERGIPDDKMVTVLNGIDIAGLHARAGAPQDVRQEFGIPDNALVVGMTGRLVPVKNFDLYLRAAARIHDALPDVLFLVIGDGPLRAELTDTARRLGIEQHVIFTGFRDDMPSVLAALDVAVLCSDSETTPYVVSEALAMGKPVVASAVGGIPEQIRTGQEGILCPPRDEDALTAALLDVLNDRGKRERMGANAARRAQAEFSLEAKCAELLRIYRDLLR